MEQRIVNEYAYGAQTNWQKMEPWFVVLTAALYFFFVFLQLNVFNALSPSLMQAFQMSADQLGELSTAYFYTSVLFLIPAGTLLDRFSTKRIILTCICISIVATVWFAFATQLWEAWVARLLVGTVGAFGLLSGVRLATRWFEPRQMALVVGLIVTMAMIGGMLAQTPLTIITDRDGWRHALMLDASLGVLFFVLIGIIVRDTPRTKFSSEKQSHSTSMGVLKELTLVMKNKQNWFAGLYASLINLPIFLLGATWGSLYLVQAHGLTRDQASNVVTMLFVGMIIGSPVSGWISDRLRKRRLPMIMGALLSMAVIVAIMYAPHLTYSSATMLFFLLGLVAGVQIIAYPLIAESNSLQFTGAAEGLASVLIMSGGFTISLFPVLLNYHWVQTIVDGVPIYSAGNYHNAMLMLPLGFLIALVAALLIHETNCQSIVKD